MKNKLLQFDVVVNKIETLTITFEELEKIVKDNDLNVDVNNLVQEDISTIYRTLEDANKYVTDETYLDEVVEGDFEIITLLK